MAQAARASAGLDRAGPAHDRCALTAGLADLIARRSSVTLVTCVQVLYLESLRIRARELPVARIFQGNAGTETRPRNRARRADLFAGQAHRPGRDRLPDAGGRHAQGTPGWQALAGACLLAGVFTDRRNLHRSADRLPQKQRARPAALVPLLRALALAARPLVWALEFLQSLFELGDPRAIRAKPPRPEEHIEALITGRRRGRHHRERATAS